MYSRFKYSEHLRVEPQAPLQRPRLLLWASLLLNVFAFVFVFRPFPRLSSVLFSGTPLGHSSYGGSLPLSREYQRCVASSQPQNAVPPAPLNPWAPLRPSEIKSIEHWLQSPDRNLNLTYSKPSALSDNTIFMIEAFDPSKKETVAYLDDPTTNNLPNRVARVTIHHGGWKEPVVKDYLVGPLPIEQSTTIRPLVDIYHRKDIPWNAGGVADFNALPEFLSVAVAPIRSAMEVRTFYFSQSAYSKRLGTIWGVLKGTRK